MKHLKALEYLSIGLILMLGSLMTFGYVFGLSGTTKLASTTVNTTVPWCSPPRITNPGTDSISGTVAISACVPTGTIGGEYRLISLYNTTYPIKIGTSSIVEPGGQITFPLLDTRGVPDNAYQLNVTLYGSSGLISTLTKNLWVRNNNTTTSSGGSTTTTTNPTVTTPTSGVSTGTNQNTTTTPQASTTTQTVLTPTIEQDLASLKTISVDGKLLSGAELQQYVETKLKEAQMANLPAELKIAPVTLVLSTEKSEIRELSNDKTKGKVTLSGKAEPNSTIYLYIFSEPIVVSVKTDSNGNWNYEMDQELDSGKHEVYVAVKNTDGTVKAKSLPYTFFVGEAIAASSGSVPDQTQSTNYAFYYLVVAISAIALVVSGIFFLVAKKHTRKNETAAS